MRNSILCAAISLSALASSAMATDQYYPISRLSSPETMRNYSSILLGYGYDSVKGDIKNRIIVTGAELELGNRNQSLELSLDMNQETLTGLTTGSLSAGGTAWGVDFNIAGAFSNKHVSDSYSQTFTLIYRADNKDSVLAPELNNWTPYFPGEVIEDTSGAPAFTAYGEEQSQQDSGDRHSTFGNEVITSIHYGAYFLATLKITYSSRAAKNAAMASLSASGYDMTLQAGFLSNSNVTQGSTNIDITMHQVGGTSAELQRALSFIGGSSTDHSEYEQDCTGNALQCEQTMNRILSYVTGKDLPSGLISFSDQLRCPVKDDCFVPTGFSAKKWSQMGFIEYMPSGGEWVLPIMTTEVIADITHEYAINSADNERAALINNSEISVITANNKAVLLRIADECKKDPYTRACGDKYEDESKNLIEYDRDF